MRDFLVRWFSITVVSAGFLAAQMSPMKQALQPPPTAPQPQPQPPTAQPPNAQQAKPATPAAPGASPAVTAPAGATTTPVTTPVTPGLLSNTDAFSVDDVPLSQMIEILAKHLKLNYILDPRIPAGRVTLHTYGEFKPVDYMPLLHTILRMNGAAMVQVGDLYRIVPTAAVAQLPINPITNADPKTLPDDERIILNMVFLKYSTAPEMDKMLTPFLSEGGKTSVYESANLLLIQDNSRSMKRLMDLINMFDSDMFAGQRVRLIEVQNSRPSDLVKDLETVFKAYALSDKSSAVHFVPFDRINTLIAIAPNPGIFPRVQEWVEKLDIPVRITAGATQVWTYRMKYQRAEIVAMAIMALYTGNTTALMGMAQAAQQSMVSAGMGMMNGGGGNMLGGGFGGGGGGYGGGYGNSMGGGYGASQYGNQYGGNMYGQNQAASPFGGQNGVPTVANSTGTGAGATGQYLGASGSAASGGPLPPGIPNVIPNPFDNTLLVKGSPQDIEQIKTLLAQLDLAPRQVLIEAKIYEVDLDNEFAEGLESYVQKNGTNAATGVAGNSNTTTTSNGSAASTISGLSPSTVLTAAAGPGGLALTAGALILKNTQLLGLLNMQESRGKSKVISAPSIIATDSIPATMNIGTQVPVLSSQGLSAGVQSGGSSVFANTVTNESSGVTLAIMARVNSSGVVTMIINQQVSAPIAPSASSAIQSPSFSNRSVSTQVTVADGEPIAIGGAITENHTESSSGIPLLHRIPLLGGLFGAKNYSTQRTELIIFLTPHVIYDTNQITEATEEIRSNLKRVGKLMKNDQ